MVIILYADMNPGEKRSQISDKPSLIAASSVYHILPYQHSKAVTVKIPSLRLDFCMLSQHVKAKGLHRADIVDHGIINGSCVKPIRPVALIQDAGLETGAVIEKESKCSVFIFPDIAFSHGKIRINFVFSKADTYRIKPG